jgi:hypothetical protein
VKGRFPLEHPKVLAKILNLSSDTLIGTIIDFVKLTLRPIDYAKESNKTLRKNNCLTQPCMKIRVSSAY